MLYAYDLPIFYYCHKNELIDAIAKVNQDVTAVSSWAVGNNLVLNCNKTKSIVLGTSNLLRNVNVNAIPKITVGDTEIPYSNCVKNLGVTLMCNLSWQNHVQAVCNRINVILYQLKTQKDLLPPHTRKQLVSSLIFPHIDYCCLVYQDITEELNVKIQRSLNMCVRFIFNIKKDDHISPYFNRLGWLKVKAKRKYLLGIYRAFHI